MEKWCILPDNLLNEISKEDNIVLHSLSRFCACKSEHLLEILKMRNQDSSRFCHVSYWYKKYRKKVGKKVRNISEPDEKLKKIQDMIKSRLSMIPVSFASTAWKTWDSVEKNAEIHKKNLYLITMDIKDAYPSIDTHRIYKNLQWALLRPLKYRCPHLENEKDKDLFVRAITHLCVSGNQLPQWASTSNQIQNIVMGGFDMKIEKKLPEMAWPKAVYSRYADDIAVSFPNFQTMEVLEEKMVNYISDIKELGLSDLLEDQEVDQIINKFSEDSFYITDNFELKYLQWKIEELKNLVSKLQISDSKKYYCIGVINGYKKNIKNSGWRIWDIVDELIWIIWGEWWKINFRKTNTWTPQSNTDREINWMAFDREGKRSLDNKKKSLYLRLLDDLAYASIWELSQNSFYEHKFKLYGNVPLSENSRKEYTKLIEDSIMGTVKWIKNYMTKIYGVYNVPRELSELCDKCLEKRQDYNKREELDYIPRKGKKEEIGKNKKQSYDINESDLPEEDDFPF